MHLLLRRRFSLAAFSCCLLMELLVSSFGVNGNTCRGGGGGGGGRGGGGGGGGGYNDVGSKTVGASDVFEAEAIRRDPLPNQTSTVRFKVHQTLKGGIGVIRRSEVVVVGYFREPGANVSVGSRYLVFAGPRNETSADGGGNSTWRRFYLMSGAPEEATKKTIKEARNHACAKCAQSPKITKEPKTAEEEEKEGQKMTLHCRANGKPTPCVTWYKDGVRIKTEKRIQIKEHRRDSRLQIKNLAASDSGVYRCQATNLLGNASSRGIRITVTGALKPHSVRCRDQSYCLNGGICYEVPLLNEQQYCVCKKDKHFSGLRCEEKQTAQIVSEPSRKKRKKKHLLGNPHHHHQQQHLDGS